MLGDRNQLHSGSAQVRLSQYLYLSYSDTFTHSLAGHLRPPMYREEGATSKIELLRIDVDPCFFLV